jgi:hypothetical protein
MVGDSADHTPIGGNMLRMTRTDRLSLAVAEAAIAHHLGIESHNALAEFVDIKLGGPDFGRRVVLIRTLNFHGHPSQKFAVAVGHQPDEDFEYEAALFGEDGTLLHTFWWDFIGPTVILMKNTKR